MLIEAVWTKIEIHLINTPKGGYMKKERLVVTPERTGHMSYDDLYEAFSYDWPAKARKLQARRWRILKEEMERQGV